MHTRRGLLRISMRSLQLALILALTGGFVLVSSSTASAVWNKPSTWFSRPSTTQVSPSSSTTRSTGAGTASDPYQCVENSTTTFDNVPLNTNRYLVVVNSSGTQHSGGATGWTATPFDRVVFNTSTGPKAELHKTSQDDVTIQSTYPFATCVLSSDTTPPPGTTPTVTLKINNSTSDVTVDKGATKNIDWNITNFASATSCSKNQNWSGPVTSATDSSSVGPLNEVKTYTYRITCYLPDNKPAVNDEIKITTQAITQTQLNPPNLTPSGNFTTSKQITITAPTTATDNSPVSSITVRYTNDNTEPNESSPSSPLTFTITGSTVVKAKAFKTGYTQSTPASAIYTKTTTQPTNHDPVVTIKQPTNNATVTNSEDLEFIVDITDQNTDQKISTVVLTEGVSISEVFFPDQAPPLSNYKLILPKDRLTLGNHTFKIEARDDYFGGYGSGYGEVKVEVVVGSCTSTVRSSSSSICNLGQKISVKGKVLIKTVSGYKPVSGYSVKYFYGNGFMAGMAKSGSDGSFTIENIDRNTVSNSDKMTLLKTKIHRGILLKQIVVQKPNLQNNVTFLGGISTIIGSQDMHIDKGYTEITNEKTPGINNKDVITIDYSKPLKTRIIQLAMDSEDQNTQTLHAGKNIAGKIYNKTKKSTYIAGRYFGNKSSTWPWCAAFATAMMAWAHGPQTDTFWTPTLSNTVFTPSGTVKSGFDMSSYSLIKRYGSYYLNSAHADELRGTLYLTNHHTAINIRPESDKVTDPNIISINGNLTRGYNSVFRKTYQNYLKNAVPYTSARTSNGEWVGDIVFAG